jgi:hypothetical protein
MELLEELTQEGHEYVLVFICGGRRFTRLYPTCSALSSWSLWQTAATSLNLFFGLNVNRVPRQLNTQEHSIEQLHPTDTSFRHIHKPYSAIYFPAGADRPIGEQLDD